VSKKVKTAPILVSAKQKDMERVVLFVDWYYDAKREDGGWNGIIKEINANQAKFPWEQKIEKAFWRGTPTEGYYTWSDWTRYPRGKLIYNSQQSPQSIDAAFVAYGDWQVDNIQKFMDHLGVMPFVTHNEQLQYKYQLDIDGATCCYPGTQWKLLSGCMVMKQDSQNVMWFSSQLVPWKHYVPLDNELGDVEEKVLWAQTHDDEAHKIAEQGREFALTHLMPEHILLYCYKTLVKYASLQRFKPLLEAGLLEEGIDCGGTAAERGEDVHGVDAAAKF
jgi:hypothetical protein